MESRAKRRRTGVVREGDRAKLLDILAANNFVKVPSERPWDYPQELDDVEGARLAIDRASLDARQTSQAAGALKRSFPTVKPRRIQGKKSKLDELKEHLRRLNIATAARAPHRRSAYEETLGALTSRKGVVARILIAVGAPALRLRGKTRPEDLTARIAQTVSNEKLLSLLGEAYDKQESFRPRSVGKWAYAVLALMRPELQNRLTSYTATKEDLLAAVSRLLLDVTDPFPRLHGGLARVEELREKGCILIVRDAPQVEARHMRRIASAGIGAAQVAAEYTEEWLRVHKVQDWSVLSMALQSMNRPKIQGKNEYIRELAVLLAEGGGQLAKQAWASALTVRCLGAFATLAASLDLSKLELGLLVPLAQAYAAAREAIRAFDVFSLLSANGFAVGDDAREIVRRLAEDEQEREELLRCLRSGLTLRQCCGHLASEASWRSLALRVAVFVLLGAMLGIHAQAYRAVQFPHVITGTASWPAAKGAAVGAALALGSTVRRARPVQRLLGLLRSWLPGALLR